MSGGNRTDREDEPLPKNFSKCVEDMIVFIVAQFLLSKVRCTSFVYHMLAVEFRTSIDQSEVAIMQLITEVLFRTSGLFSIIRTNPKLGNERENK